MSDLAERIRAAVERRNRNAESIASEGGASGISHWPTTQERNELRVELSDLLHDNAPTLLAGLAALEERDKLRAALLYARDVLFVLPSVIANNDEIDRRINKGIAMIDAALQPTPEQTKESGQ